MHSGRAAVQPVIQEEVTGCGIASVAALAGVSYRVAKQAGDSLGIRADDPRLWSETHHVRRLLEDFGLRATPGEAPFSDWASLPSPALLAIKWRRVNHIPFWHWVVFVRGKHGAVVLDPKATLKRNVRTDFGRMKPRWFIAVAAVAPVA